MIETGKSYDVIIAGGGPAGTSAAIHLATHDLTCLLVEKKIFPRPKLCGEFISPECMQHFEKLGVALEMQSSQPAEIKETVFYSRRGRKTVVPSHWFGRVAALGLSRAAMDDNLLNRAKAAGVDVLNGATVTKLVSDKGGARGICVRTKNADFEYQAPIIIDATGRVRGLARKVRTQQTKKPKLVAFKAHLRNTGVARTACEIYSYPGGYGGLSMVENELSNLCFIIDVDYVRQANSDPEAVLRQNVMLNPRAAFTLREAKVSSEWLSVAIESFGRHRPSPMNGLLAIGDAASFIDPFTGSGMLMALESGELVSKVIIRHKHKLKGGALLESLSSDYSREYRKKFDSRLRLCGLLRRVAFRPLLAQLTISICANSDRFSGWLARATRSTLEENAA